MVHFTMRGYRFQTPYIEQEDLIVYYDFKGKTNYDKHRDVALNMFDARDRGDIRNSAYKTGSGFNSHNALEFDGIDDYIRLDLGKVSKSELTIEMSFRLDKTLPYQTIIKCGAVPYAWWLRYNNNKIELVSNDTVVASADTTGYLDAVTHLAITLSSSNISIWLDGSLLANTALSLTEVYGTSTPVYLGAAYPNKHYLKGVVSTFRVYGRRLTNAQLLNNRTIDKNRWDNR